MNKKVNPLLLWGNFYAFVVTGMAVLITGAVLPYLLDEFSLRYDQGGLLLGLQAVGNLASSIGGGVLSDYVGRKAVLGFGALCFVIGFGGAVITSSSVLLFVFLFIAGIGWGVMNSLVNAVVSDATAGASSVMNLLHMFFAIGAFVSPFMVGLMARFNINWRYSLIVVSALSLILFFIFLLMPVDPPERTKKSAHSTVKPFSSMRFYLFMVILFLYVGTENSINGWMVTYLSSSSGMTVVKPQDILSLFWITIIIGRLLSAYSSKFFSKECLLLIYSLGGAVSFALFLISAHQIFIIICVAAMGLMYAGIYPTTVANASTLIQGSGTAAGVMLSFGGLGGAVVPYINGLVAESRGLHAGMSTIMLSAVLLGIASLSNVWMKKRK